MFFANLRSNDSIVSSILPLLFVPQDSSFGATLISRAVEVLGKSQTSSPDHLRGTKLLSKLQRTKTLSSGTSPSPPVPPPSPPPRALLPRRALPECSFAAGDRLTNSSVTFHDPLGRGRPLAGGRVARPPSSLSSPTRACYFVRRSPRRFCRDAPSSNSSSSGAVRAPCAGRGGS